MRFSRPLLAGLFPLAMAVALAAPDDMSRRLFDFTPVSPANPVVATVDGAGEIPLSELRGYYRAERAHALPGPLSLAQKRGVLDELIGEYLLVDDAYRTGVTRSPGFVHQMEATRTMLLTDFLAVRTDNAAKAALATADATAKAVPPTVDATTKAALPTADATALANRLFAAALLDISNEAYDLVRRRAALIDRTSAESRRGPVVDPRPLAEAKLRDIVEATPDVPVVKYEGKTITTRQILVIYAGLPPPRPAVATHEDFLALIKPMVVPELMAIEAAQEGIAADPAFQQKLVQNRNTLLRFHQHGVFDREANAAMRAPGFAAQLHAWYDAHRSDYRLPPEQGGGVASFAAAAQRVEADCSVALVERLKVERIAALRARRRIVVNEAALRAW